MIDHNNKTWVLADTLLTCEDGRAMYVDPAMTEAYLLQVIADMDKPRAPEAVNMRQARLALLGAGLLSAVSASIAAMPGIEGDAARIEWEFAATVRRDSPLIAQLISGFGWPSATIDQLFLTAAGL